MIKAVILLALVAVFAFAAESDIQICVQGKLGKICYTKDEVESDAEFPWLLAAKAAYGLYKKYKKDDVESDKMLPLKPRKILPCLKCFKLFDKKDAAKACFQSCRNATKTEEPKEKKVPVKKSKKPVPESDIAWVPVAIWAGKALAGGALSAAGAHAYDKFIRRKDNVESDFSLACTAECTAYYTCKAKGAWNGNTANCPYPTGCECRKFAWQKDETEADAEFFKKLGGLVKKVAPIAKKGFDIYKKAKGFGILADAEAEKLNLKELIQKIKDKIRARKEKKAKKQQEQPAETESDKFFKKLGGLVKKVAPVVKKGFDIYKKAKGFGILADAEAEKSEFFKKLIEKIKEKIRARKEKKAKKQQEQPAETEADAEFFKKLKQWWNNKGKNLVEKGVNIYNKGKELGLIKDEAEADLKIKLPKPKDILPKVLPLILKDEAESEEIDKCAACHLACSLIKDEKKKALCDAGCDALACKK